MAVFLGQRSRSTENATCSICLEEFKNRRCLPCLHSFCLGCLERHCKDKLPGDNAFCPLCRTTFQIPQNGLDDLKDPMDSSRHSKKICEACSTAQGIILATVYCVDCSQLLCERCSLPHKKMPGGPHSIRQLVEPDASESGLLIHCDKHAEEIAKLFCFDCKVNICMNCFSESHKQHNCQKAEAAVTCRKAVLHVESENRKFLDSVKTVKRQVKERGETVMRVVDGHVNNLLLQLDKIESDTMKETNALTETLNVALSDPVGSEAEHSSSAQSFKAARSPSTEELVMACIAASCYSAPDVAFIPADIDELTTDEKNTVGSVMKIADSGLSYSSNYVYTVV